MVSTDKNVMRFICPALAIVATLVALFGQWFTRTTQITQKTIDSTLLEVLQGESFVEYTSSRWIWLSAVGVVLVIASAAVNDQMRKKLAEGGSYLLIILPAWSMFQVYVGDENIGAGWGMWIVTVLAIAVLILARMIPEEKPNFVAPQIEQ